MQREKVLAKLRAVGERIVELTDEDCKGVPTVSLSTIYHITRSSLLSIIDEQEKLSVDEVAERYGVTMPTIYNWLHKHNLPKPYKVEDQHRSFIDKETIAKLDELYSRQDI